MKAVSTATLKNVKIDTNGERVKWLNIRWLRFLKDDPEHILFKYEFEEEFRKILVTGKSKRGQQVRPITCLPPLYKERLPVSAAKKQDLLSLCTSGLIPEEHHHFYGTLPVSESETDKLPEPDTQESDVEDE